MNLLRLNSIILILILSLTAEAQNLVPNPGFETYSVCPSTYNQVTNATGWLKSGQNNTGSTHAEFLNSCAGSGSSGFGAPMNVWGNQAPATGQGYMVIATTAPTISANYRENIYAQLSSNLVVGKAYRISFKVSLADNSKSGSNNVSLKLSTSPTFLVNNSAHLTSANVVTSQMSWTLISDTIIADSAYKYLAIGNFFDDANLIMNTVCSSCPFQHVGYYFDDIEVTPVSLASAQEVEARFDWNIYPNPANTSVTIVSDKNFSKGNLMITDVAGRSVRSSEITELAGNSASMDISNLAPGTYYVTLSNDRGTKSIKLVVAR